MRQRLFRVVLSIAGLSILVVLFYRLGPENIFQLLRQIGWKFLGVVAIYGVQEIVRAMALVQCLRRETRPAFRELLYIRFAGEAVRALTLTGPFLAEPTRALLIRRRGVSSTEAVAATAAEYVANSFVAAVLTIAGAVYLLNYLQPTKELRITALVLFFGSVGYLAIAFIVLVRRAYVAAGTATAIARLTGLESRIAAALAALRRVEDALLFVLRDRPGPAARLAALECLAHFLLLFETYWALNSMGVVVSFVTAALVEILTKLANVASAGVTEGAYAFLFKALMLPPAAGFTLSLVKRLRSLALAAIGLGTMTVIPDRTGRFET